MNNTTIENPIRKSGSIAVYQRLLPGKRPAKVEVIRSVYETCEGPGDRAFGRRNNTVLLRVPSGMDCLCAEDTATLKHNGLNEKQIAHVNQRLTELAGPARERALEMDVVEAQSKLSWVVALAEAAPMVTKRVRDLVRAAVDQLGVDDAIGPNFSEPEAGAPHEALKNALSTINRVCLEAQELYKLLPKGELPENVVLEFQKSWFSYQDMLATLTVRKSLARPSGWSKLRAQVRAGTIHRKGVSILE